MKKNKKPEYSLTAKQRKEQREQQEQKAAAKKTAKAAEGDLKATDEPLDNADNLMQDGSAVELEGEVAGGAVKAKKLDKKSILIISIASFLAVVLIVMAILIPTVIYPRVRYSRANGPVAVIYLSNGMELEFEIFEEDCPIAATNFLYLAKKGFFDNTIIFDVQNDYVRLGGYTDSNDYTKNKETDDSFNSSLKDITPPENNDQNRKLFYRLNKDSGNIASIPFDEAGVLSYMYDNGAARFQLCARDGAIPNVSGESGSSTFSAVRFGRFFSPKTLENIKEINRVKTKPVTTNGMDGTWKTPESTIRIKKIKLYNMNKGKWKNFHFGNDFLASGKGNLSRWTNS